jgi:glucose-6-phosphate 1-dehydrogenase
LRRALPGPARPQKQETREDAVEGAWAVVDPVLADHHPAHPCVPGTWGPEQADELVAPHNRWHNP